MLLLVLSCTRPESPSAAWERACRSACAVLTRPSCPAEEPPALRRNACTRSCVEFAETATRAGCWEQHRSYLDCLSKRSVDCPPKSLSAGIALENAFSINGCRKEHDSYFQCTEPCRDRGVQRTRSLGITSEGKEQQVSVELIQAGCGPAPIPPIRRSGAGAPCTHHTVCSTTLCRCAGREVTFLARACVDGHCAGESAACKLAPQVVGYRPCGPGGHAQP